MQATDVHWFDKSFKDFTHFCCKLANVVYFEFLCPQSYNHVDYLFEIIVYEEVNENVLVKIKQDSKNNWK